MDEGQAQKGEAHGEERTRVAQPLGGPTTLLGGLLEVWGLASLIYQVLFSNCIRKRVDNWLWELLIGSPSLTRLPR